MYHYGLYALAFLNGETLAMVEQQKWLASKPWTETFGLALASDTEAFAGHLQKARELTQSSEESAVKTNNKESGALWWETAALREARLWKSQGGTAGSGERAKAGARALFVGAG
jgi:hypothetical protein